ncbi:hypothetical protein [Cardiobacterium hominis]|uniref:hypothetical protein n=1 Tax=Cardiobacterium hominis TaxID=2718 RepID=UPI001E38025A|nr:hypothetical protein [Cardiobacterium hominis]
MSILQQGGNGFFLFLPGFLVLCGFFVVGSEVLSRFSKAIGTVCLTLKCRYSRNLGQGKEGIRAIFADGNGAFLFELRDQCRIGFDLRSGCDGAECAEENVLAMNGVMFFPSVLVS